jgi:hypothetical protein
MPLRELCLSVVLLCEVLFYVLVRSKNKVLNKWQILTPCAVVRQLELCLSRLDVLFAVHRL